MRHIWKASLDRGFRALVVLSLLLSTGIGTSIPAYAQPAPRIREQEPPTLTPEPTVTELVSLTATEDLTPTAEITVTAVTATPTPTEIITLTASPSPTVTETITLTPTIVSSPTVTVTPTLTVTPTPTRIVGDHSSAVMFIENVGQIAIPTDTPREQQPKFSVRGAVGTIYLAPAAVWVKQLVMATGTPVPITEDRGINAAIQATPPPPRTTIGGVVNMRFALVNSDPQTQMVGFDPLDTAVSYLLGDDPAQWRSEVPTWGGVRYEEVYPGVDLEITSNNGTWLWRLVLKTDDATALRTIALQMQGADRYALVQGALGDTALRVTSPGGEFDLPLFQVVDVNRRALSEADLRAAGITADPNFVGDTLQAPFAALRPAKADQKAPGLARETGRDILAAPVAKPLSSDGDINLAEFSTFLGGSQGEASNALEVDVSGNNYVAGITASDDFTFATGYSQTYAGNYDVFVGKLNNFGTNLLYLTYLGGPQDDWAWDINVDGAGSAYVTGYTLSGSFPTTTNAFDRTYNGVVDSEPNGFITKLSIGGTALSYSSLFGRWVQGSNLAVVPTTITEVVMVGQVSWEGAISTTTGALRTTPSADYDGFIAKFDTSKSGSSSLVYSTYLAGTGADCEQGGYLTECDVAVDTSGNIYVAGPTYSTDFITTTTAYDPSHNGSSDTFILKLNPAGGGSSDLLYSTFLGASGQECYENCRITLGANNQIYVAGQTSSLTLPKTDMSTYQGGDYDVFIAALDMSVSGSAGLKFLTYFGSTGEDRSQALAVNDLGQILIAGDVNTNTLPITINNAFDKTFDGTSCGTFLCRDGFIAKIGPDGQVLYASYLGGQHEDFIYDAVNGAGETVITTGNTQSSDFPIKPNPGAYKTDMEVAEGFVTSLIAPTILLTRTVGSPISVDRENNAGVDQPIGYTPGVINTKTGGFSYKAADMTVETVANPLIFERTYAANTIGLYTAPLGPGWTHSQDVRLIFPTDPGGEPNKVWVKSHSANQYQFNIITSTTGLDTFTPYAGVTSVLTYSVAPTTVYTLTHSNQSVYIFDSNKRLVKWLDPQQHPIDYLYDAQGRVITVTEVLTTPRFLAMTYNASGLMTSVKDNAGRQVSFGYDAFTSDLITVTDVLSQTWIYTYTNPSLLTHIVDPRGKTVLLNAYDAQGRAISQTDGLGQTMVQVGYVLTNTAVLTDARGITMTQTYDDRNTLISNSMPLGNVVNKSYDANFRPNNVVDPRGNATQLSWSANGVNITAKRDAENNITRLTYDSFNNLTQTVDARGYTTTMTYSGTLLTSSTDVLGNKTILTYTTAADAPQPGGLLKSKTDPRGNITRYEYDFRGQRVAMTDTVGVVTRYAYDNIGRLITTTVAFGTPLQRVTVNVYDNASRLTKVTENYLAGTPDPNRYNLVTQYAYDQVGNTILITDTLGRVTRTEYDALNRPITTTVNYINGLFDPLKPDEDVISTKAYDLVGNVITQTMYAGAGALTRKTFTQYDQLNRPVTVTVNYVNGGFDPLKPDEDVQSVRGYDTAGNVVTMTMYANAGSLARTTITGYDNINRPVTITVNYVDGTFDPAKPDEDVRTIKAYDANSNVVSVTSYVDAAGLTRQTVTQYDEINRPILVTTNYIDGNPTVGEADTDIRTAFGYDQNGNVLTATQYSGLTNLARSTVTQYDALNRPLTITTNYVDGLFLPSEPDRDIPQTMRYDVLGNVITTTQFATISGLARTEYIQFDELSRPITVTTNYTNTGVFDPLKPDQNIQRINQYDPASRLITSTQASNISNLARKTLFQYDLRDRVISTTINYVNGAFDPLKPDEDVRRQSSYDVAGNVLTATLYTNVPNLTRSTVTSYDLLNRPISYTTNYTGTGVFTATRPAENIQTLTAYDGAGNVLTTTAYANVTNLTRRTFAQYDLMNRPISVTTNYTGTGAFVSNKPDENIQQLLAYNAAGQVITSTQFANIPSMLRQTVNQYDLLDRRTQTVESYENGTFIAGQPDRDIKTLMQYDQANNVLTTTLYAGSAQERLMVAQYDLLNRPIKTTANYQDGAFVGTQPDRDVVNENGYDAASNRIRSVEYRGGPGLTTTPITTTYGFDLLNRQITTTVPLTGTQVATLTVRYDALNRPIDQVDALSHTVRTAFDQMDRPITVTTNFVDGVYTSTLPYEDLLTVHTYDGAGNRVQVRDANGVVTAFDYDLLNRPITVTENFISGGAVNAQTNVRTVYTYDAASNRLRITDGRSNSTNFTYDLLNRQLSVSNPLTHTTVYTYDAASNRLQMRDALTVTTLYTYDLLNRLLTIDYPDATGDVTFAYNAASNRTSMTDGLGVTTWQYDLFNRPITITDPFTGTVAYGYDSLGNRLSLQYPDGKVVKYAYDLAARLVTATDWLTRTTSYAYDAANRLTTIGRPNAITTTYGYDNADRLVLLAHQNVTQTLSSYAYTVDAVGNRMTAVESVLTATVVPTVPTSGLQMWFRADVGITTTVGNPVLQWNDQSGNGRNATQNTAANRPTLTGNALNGKPVVTFDGSNDFLGFTYAPNNLSGMTMVIVGRNQTDNTDYGGFRAALMWEETGFWGATFLTPFRSNVPYRFGTGQVNNKPVYIRPTTLSNTDYTITIATHDNTTDSLYINGDLVHSEPGKLSFTNLISTTGYLGRGLDALTFGGAIAEVLVYSRTLSAGERQQVEGYLNNKYFPPVANNVITVTTASDDFTNNGNCSLREAITAANSNATRDACVTGSSTLTDTIVLTSATYTLTIVGSDNTNNAGDLDITGKTLLQGVSADQTIITGTTGWNNGIIHVLTTAGVQLDRLTVRGGGNVSGSGLRSENGPLTLSNVMIRNNTTNSVGAGLWLTGTGTINIINSAILSNTTTLTDVNGAGLYLNSSSLTVNISNTTFSGNSASGGGGAIKAFGSSTFNLNNVTIISNTADSDANNTGQGGGIDKSGTTTVNIRNSVLAGNTDAGATKAPDCNGTITSQGFNLVGNNLNCTFTSTTGDSVGTSGSPIAPLLGLLALNGSTTLSRAPLAGSPAIDTAHWAAPGSGGTTCMSTDQRGFTRPTDGDGNGDARCDRGAIELGATGTPLAASTVITYAYDPLYRLTETRYTLPSGTAGNVFTYTYDAVGNRLRQLAFGVTTVYTYDIANRLTNVGNLTYTWNANGNLINDGAYTYTYDVANRMVTLKQGTAITSTFGYNGVGDRLRQVTNGVTTTYSLDLASGLTQVLADGTNTYFYGNGRVSQQNAVLDEYFLADAIGSVRQTADITGTVTVAKGYQPFGSILNNTGHATSNYGFTGEWTDGSGLINLRARYYAPWQGRFISADPWAGDPNRPMSYNKWLYAYSNPINLMDPTGLRPSCQGIPDCDVDGWRPPPPPKRKPPVSTPPPVISPPPAQNPAAGDEGLENYSPPPSSTPNQPSPSPVAAPEDDPIMYMNEQHCSGGNCTGQGVTSNSLIVSDIGSNDYGYESTKFLARYLTQDGQKTNNREPIDPRFWEYDTMGIEIQGVGKFLVGGEIGITFYFNAKAIREAITQLNPAPLANLDGSINIEPSVSVGGSRQVAGMFSVIGSDGTVKEQAGANLIGQDNLPINVLVCPNKERGVCFGGSTTLDLVHGRSKSVAYSLGIGQGLDISVDIAQASDYFFYGKVGWPPNVDIKLPFLERFTP